MHKSPSYPFFIFQNKKSDNSNAWFWRKSGAQKPQTERERERDERQFIGPNAPGGRWTKKGSNCVKNVNICYYYTNPNHANGYWSFMFIKYKILDFQNSSFTFAVYFEWGMKYLIYLFKRRYGSGIVNLHPT